MWQLVFVAAVAGSSILVKHLFRNGDKGGDHHHPVRVSSVSELKEEEEENIMEVQRKEEEEEADSWMSEKLLLLHPVVAVVEDEGSSSSIFRFTSSSSSSLEPGGEGGRSGSRSSGNEEDNSVKRRSSSTSSSRGEKKLMMLEEEEEDQRNKGIRRRRNVSFCLKRRRTCKIAFRNSGSCKEESKGGNSLFSCGVGFGFMLSARKAEFNKLTAADIEEITQVTITSCKDGANMESMGMNKEEPLLMMTDLSAKLATPNDPEVLDLSSNGDGECPSSILTEEVDLEALEMDRLEAELESELQKIPDEDDPEYFMDFPSTELSADALEKGPQEPLGMDPKFCGVLPTELDRKLCHVLIKQQESQIAELESNLYLSQMKLREKDAELRKLKAVVCSLRDFSLETASDGESEDCVILDEVEEGEEEKEMKNNADSLIYPRSDDDGSNKITVLVKEQKKSLCGVKRLMEFESYANCQE